MKVSPDMVKQSAGKSFAARQSLASPPFYIEGKVKIILSRSPIGILASSFSTLELATRISYI
jgi:hypothetical protein